MREQASPPHPHQRQYSEGEMFLHIYYPYNMYTDALYCIEPSQRNSPGRTMHCNLQLLKSELRIFTYNIIIC